MLSMPFILMACTDESNTNSVNTAKDAMKYGILDELNKTNTMSEVGISHNESLDDAIKYFDALEKKTRTSIPDVALSDSLAKEFFADEYMKVAKEHGYEGFLTRNQFKALCDTCLKDIRLLGERQIGFITKRIDENLSADSKSFLNSLWDIMNDKRTNLQHKLEKIKIWERNVKNSVIDKKEVDVLLGTSSVAANSMTYWEDFGGTMISENKGKGNDQQVKKIDWGDVAMADVGGAATSGTFALVVSAFTGGPVGISALIANMGFAGAMASYDNYKWQKYVIEKLNQQR